jgi:hypothetical protein
MTKRYTVSDGKWLLNLEEAEEGGYIGGPGVRNPLQCGWVKTIALTRPAARRGGNGPVVVQFTSGPPGPRRLTCERRLSRGDHPLAAR